MRAGRYYKIGRTTNLDGRLSALSTQLPFPVDLVRSFKVANAPQKEHTLHERFADKRVRGEWFQLSPDDVRWLLEQP